MILKHDYLSFMGRLRLEGNHNEQRFNSDFQRKLNERGYKIELEIYSYETCHYDDSFIDSNIWVLDLDDFD